MIDFIKDVTGDKKSSKRLAGLSCVGVGLLIALIALVADAAGASVNVELVKTVLTGAFTTGTALLGIGAVEYFSGRQNKNAGNGVGYKRE